MYKFDIELPKEVLTPGKHDYINFNALEGKIITSLMGHARSGKDSIAKVFVEDYGYQRVAFADNIKKEMNLYLKEKVFQDIKRGDALFLFKLDEIDFFTENIHMKQFLRPYIIWYGEKLRTINGKFCWINRAFEEEGKNMDKIVLSDVRRLAELDIFRDSNEFKRRARASMSDAGITNLKSDSLNNYGTLLLEVNQLGLSDTDNLTLETIKYARENWLIDDTFYVDSRIPELGEGRKKAIIAQVKRIAKKYGIEKPEKGKYTQTNIFQLPGVVI